MIFDAENNDSYNYSGSYWYDGNLNKNFDPSANYGAARKENNNVDLYFTTELDAVTDISAIYYFGHPNVNLNACTYEIYVGNDLGDDLYKSENLVAYYDYSNGTNDHDVFNGSTSSKKSQGEIWSFTEDNKPRGKYVGFKVYDACQHAANRLDVYDIGVFGTEIATAEDYISVETVSNSSKTANLMPATTTYAKDTVGNAVNVLKVGGTYTFGVNDTDARYNFEGWYKKTVQRFLPIKSSQPSLTVQLLLQKYTTDAILNINPSAGNALVWTQANGVVGTFAYDSAKNAYKFNTTTAGNSSTIGSLKYGNVNLLSNQYEANTTYKITVKGEVVDNTPDDGNDAAVRFTLSPSVYGNLNSIGEYKPSAAFTATKYFFIQALPIGAETVT